MLASQTGTFPMTKWLETLQIVMAFMTVTMMNIVGTMANDIV
jgi:hypothetical protein